LTTNFFRLLYVLLYIRIFQKQVFMIGHGLDGRRDSPGYDSGRRGDYPSGVASVPA